MKVLLVGNYPTDAQESMGRFADVLAEQLPLRGVAVERICPAPKIGRLRPSADGIGKWLGYVDKFVFFPALLRKRVQHLRPWSIVHICDHSNAVYLPLLEGVPHLVTCHDLLAIRSALGEFPGHSVGTTGRLYQRLILKGLNSTRNAACVSTATARDLSRLTESASRHVAVVHNGLNYPYSRLPEATVAARLTRLAQRSAKGSFTDLPEGFILHVGGNQWYKNREGVIQIYSRLREKMSSPPLLVMVGKPFTPAMRQMISAHNLGNRVVELNGVSNEDLQALYCAARLLLFPSSHEGFGWPIVEAQACGCPVVIARREPMTEIGGGAAVFFEFEAGPDRPLTSRSAGCRHRRSAANPGCHTGNGLGTSPIRDRKLVAIFHCSYGGRLCRPV